jgi:methylthioribose-1-phosphate isomerase
MGVALGVRKSRAQSSEELKADFETITSTLAGTRPTAVNLFWAIERMKQTFSRAIRANSSRSTIERLLIDEAKAIYDEDIENNKRMGRFGADLLPESGTILTHCNAGALATAGYETALGVIRAAVERGKRLKVLADANAPLPQQGARLTAGTLEDDIDVRVIADSRRPALHAQRSHHAVIVGALHCGNGTAAGGWRNMRVWPDSTIFRFCGPPASVDLSTPDGSHIPIEQQANKVTHIRRRFTAEGSCSILY